MRVTLNSFTKSGSVSVANLYVRLFKARVIEEPRPGDPWPWVVVVEMPVTWSEDVPTSAG